MRMIIGLGNPGGKYELTKHNVGFWVIDALAQEMNERSFKQQCQALVANGIVFGQKVLLVKPQTFMNLSGQAVIELLHYYKDRIDDLLVIHDDLDLPPGQIRFKQKGSAGGHNGIKSIVQHLNSNDFDRLKLGIGRGSNSAADYVLTPFGAEAKKQIDDAVKLSVAAVDCWLNHGIASAMNQFNQKKK